MQPPVASGARLLRFVAMGADAKTYWSERCRTVKWRREELKKKWPNNTELAREVERLSGKRTTRAVLEHFFNGRREPYVSQLAAICELLELSIDEVLRPSTPKRQPLIRGSLRNLSSEKTHTFRRKERNPD